jgi:hypothetical protein
VTTGSTSSNPLSWTSSAGATGYRVYRGVSAGGEDRYYDVGNVTSYTDTNAAVTANNPPVYIGRATTVGPGPARVVHSAGWSLRTDALVQSFRNSGETAFSARVGNNANDNWTVTALGQTYYGDGVSGLSANIAATAGTTNKSLSVTGQMRVSDGVQGKYLTGAGKTTVVDGDFVTAPPDGTTAVHWDSTASKSYLSVRASGTWHVMAGPI